MHETRSCIAYRAAVARCRFLEYRSWAALGGYFDGDGTVEELVGDFVVGVRLGFSDNWPEQLLAVRRFLVSQGIRLGNLTRSRRKGIEHAWKLMVCNKDAVLTMATKMLPHVVKKKAELEAVVLYLNDRITGDEFVSRVNHEVAIGDKLGKYKHSTLPCTRAEGNRARRVFSPSRAREVNLVKIPDQVLDAVGNDYGSGEFSMRELSKRHSLAIWLVQRILGKRSWQTQN